MIRLTHAQLQPIGLDIGRDSIRMLQLEVAGGALSVRAARKTPRDGTALEETIRQTLRESAFAGRRVVAALPREIVHIKNYRLPPMPAPELEAAVQLEAASLFSFEAEQACIHCIPAGEVRQGNEVLQEVIVMAALNEQIDAFVEQLHRCGLAVESLDIEPCALYRSVERFVRRREDEQEVQVLVDVGYSGSRVVIGRGRDISFIKSIDIGGMHFQQAVSDRLGITPPEAQALRRRSCSARLPDSALSTQHSALPQQDLTDSVRRAVFDAARGVMEQLGQELALCLRYQAVTFRGCRPARLRLLGGEAADADLQAVLGSMLTIPVEVGRPMYSVDTSRMTIAERRGPMSEWAVALGLGLRRTEQRFAPRDGKPRDSARLEPALGADSASPVPEEAHA